MKIYHSKRGFSLIEVSFALAIASLCLLTIYGLLLFALAEDHDLLSKNQATKIITSITVDIRSTPRSSSSYNSIRYQIPLPAIGTTNPMTSNLYFDVDGNLLNSPDRSVYTAIITITPSPTNQPATSNLFCSVRWSVGSQVTPQTAAQEVELSSILDFN